MMLPKPTCQMILSRVLPWVCLGICSISLRAAEEDAGLFRSVFDGHSLEGWRAPEMEWWSVDDGAITGRITPGRPCGTNQYLVWQGGELADFELKLKSRLQGAGAINNGFQFRSRVLPDGDVAGYQVDNNLQTDWLVRLYDEFGRHTLAWRGKQTVLSSTGVATTTELPEGAGTAWFRLEDWHEYHLLCEGPRLTLRVDGRLAAQVEDHDLRRADLQGALALQLHSGPPTVVQFKDIRLRIVRPATPPQFRPPERRRTALLSSGLAHWDFGSGGHQREHPLRYVGSLDDVEFNVRVLGSAERRDRRVALLRGGYFDAGTNLVLSGQGLTVLARVLDPTGDWRGTLLSQSAPGSTAPSLRLFGSNGSLTLEIQTVSGAARVDFPVTQISKADWVNLVGRYDGRDIELSANGRVLAREAWKGGPLAGGRNPLWIGATQESGKVGDPFHGEFEEIAIWSRALTDREIGTLTRIPRR